MITSLGTLNEPGNRRPPRRVAPPVGVRVDRVVSRHARWLGNLEEGLRILCSHQQQGSSCARRRTAPLLPFLQCAHRYTKQCGELPLRQASTFTNRSHGWNVHDSSDLTALQLAQTLQNFCSNVSLCNDLSHQFHP